MRRTNYCGGCRDWGKAVAVLGLIGCGAALFSWGERDLVAGPQNEKERQESVLATHMEEMNTALRRVRKMIKQPNDPAAILADVGLIQEHAVAAKGLVPEKIQELAHDQQPPALTDFRRQMIALLEALLRLEKQVLDGQYAPASDTCIDIMGIMEEGHKKFRKKKE